VQQNIPDAGFGATFAKQLTHIETAATAALHTLNDIQTNGVVGNTDVDLGAVNSALHLETTNILAHSLPPPDYWLV
jgi:hypothetical protein